MTRRKTIWHYPAKWLHEEKFWFDMTTRTLSSLVAAFVVATVVLVISAWTPDERVTVIGITVATIGTLIVLAFIVGVISLTWETVAPRRTHIYPSRGGVSFRLGQGRLKDELELAPDADRNYVPEWLIYQDRALDRYREKMSEPKNQNVSLGMNYRDLPEEQ